MTGLVRATLAHAACPVAVVPADDPERPKRPSRPTDAAAPVYAAVTFGTSED
jgi:hypothetical protein